MRCAAATLRAESSQEVALSVGGRAQDEPTMGRRREATDASLRAPAFSSAGTSPSPIIDRLGGWGSSPTTHPEEEDDAQDEDPEEDRCEHDPDEDRARENRGRAA